MRRQLIRTNVHVVDGKAKEVSILNVPTFLYKEDLCTELSGVGEIHFDISFGGSFFALVNAREIGISLELQNVEKLTQIGMELREKINRTVEIRHPYLDITTVDLVEFYDTTENEQADLKNCVVFGDAQVDRSPCGTGTSAKMVALYAKGKMKPGDTFIYESITGSLFKGEIAQEVEIDGKNGIIPKITGSAYITGNNNWILDDDDPLECGFLLGTMEEQEESVRSRIVRAAWSLFGEKGYKDTSVADIIERAKIKESEFYEYFTEKDELQDTMGDLFDQKYVDLMVSMNPRFSQYEKLVYLNQALFGLIEEGQKTGEFSKEDSAENLADNYASLERGMIYDWCLKGGSYSLREKGKQLLPIYLQSLRKAG